MNSQVPAGGPGAIFEVLRHDNPLFITPLARQWSATSDSNATCLRTLPPSAPADKAIYSQTSVLCLMQLTICSSRVRSNPTITSPHAEITGTLRAPDSLTISSRAARSLLTSYSVNLKPFCERNSFAILQYGHVCVEYTLISSAAIVVSPFGH